MANAALSHDDRSRYIEQVFDKHYARLQIHFLRQFGNLSEADDCVEETICRFFIFMEGHGWEEEANDIHVHLLRIACNLCLQKLRAKRSHSVSAFDLNRYQSGSFNKIRDESIQSIEKRLHLTRHAPHMASSESLLAPNLLP